MFLSKYLISHNVLDGYSREKIVLRGDRVRQLIPKNIPISQTEDFVCKALEHYNKFLRSRADRDSR